MNQDKYDHETNPKESSNFKIISLLESNNKILKNIEARLNIIEGASIKMDTHINDVMGIYNVYKAPLDYISSYFSFKTLVGIKTNNNEIEK